MKGTSSLDNNDIRQVADVLLARQQDRISLLPRSEQSLGAELKATADETLFLELALRGYDLSKLRDEPTTATSSKSDNDEKRRDFSQHTKRSLQCIKSFGYRSFSV